MENQQTPEGIKKIIDSAIDAVTDKLSVRDGRICYANFSGSSYEAENINQEDLVDKIFESILPIISHHQEANEINVCFSKPYQNLQRELFEKKKESELFKEANAKLVEALRAVKNWTDLSNEGHNVPYPFEQVEQALQTYETK